MALKNRYYVTVGRKIVKQFQRRLWLSQNFETKIEIISVIFSTRSENFKSFGGLGKKFFLTCESLAMRILALDFVSKNEKRRRKRRGAKCPRKGHTVLGQNFFRSCIMSMRSLTNDYRALKFKINGISIAKSFCM